MKIFVELGMKRVSVMGMFVLLLNLTHLLPLIPVLHCAITLSWK
jgi:hypothetical protein